MNDQQLCMFTVYERPQDFPESYVVRRSVLYCGNHPLAGTVAMDDSPMAVVSTLEQARAVIPQWLHCLPRSADDVPCIKEVWI
jgi:hypothetical protein